MIKKEVAILGGSFNPVTLGHMSTAMAVYARTGLPVWFMPCHYHQFHKTLIPGQNRLEMCRLITEALGEPFFTSDYEIKNGYYGSTYNLLKVLKATYPDILFHLVIGTDNVQPLLTSWENGQQLIQENPVIVMNRAGFSWNQEFDSQPWLTIKRIEEISFPSASTDFRDLMIKKHYIEAQRMLLPRVWNYIKVKKLYGFEQ